MTKSVNALVSRFRTFDSFGKDLARKTGNNNIDLDLMLFFGLIFVLWTVN